MDDAEAAQVQQWADRLGVDRSELLRDAVRRHLLRLASEDDAARWEKAPLDEGERALAEIAEWLSPVRMAEACRTLEAATGC